MGSLCEVVVGRAGTRYLWCGEEASSDKSTLTYVLYASPSDDSGTQASRYEAASLLFDEEG
jgi:hypothetical protein